MPARVRLGELLVDARIISQEQLDEVLAKQKQDGRRLGTLLVESGLVTETQVTQILSQQLSVPWVSLYHIDFSRQLLNLVPQETAREFCLVPIFVRRVRGLGETLYVAMDDPSDDAALQAVGEYAGLPVRAMIAPPSDIVSAIRVYYGSTSEPPGALGPTASATSEPVEDPTTDAAPSVDAARPVSLVPDDIEEIEESSPVPSLPAPAGIPEEAGASGEPAEEDADPAQEAVRSRVQASRPEPSEGARAVARLVAREAESSPPSRLSSRAEPLPHPKKGPPAKLVTLTLLDGTQVNLPARGQEQEEPAAGGELTARDMVAALRALSQGADASEVLGDDVNWQRFFAALLSLLLKKHLIADWEFVDEYQNNDV